MLRYLLSRPGHLVSAEELLEHVWDENADPFTQTVRVTVGTLRRKLTVHPEPQLLETVTGREYRLRADEPVDTPHMIVVGWCPVCPRGVVPSGCGWP